MNNGQSVQLVVKYQSSDKCKCKWFFKEAQVSENHRMKIIHEKINSNCYEYRLEIHEPTKNSAGCYKALVKNDYGQLQVNLNLSIEAGSSLASSTEDMATQQDEIRKIDDEAPTFIAKPEIVAMNNKNLVQFIVRYQAPRKCNCNWFYKEKAISENQKMRIFHEEINVNAYEYRLEINEPNKDTAGTYKCIVMNHHGQLQVNLNLNVGMDMEGKVIKKCRLPRH